MTDNIIKIGYSYFREPQYLIRKQVQEWLPALKSQGASLIIFESSFNRAIPEDVFTISGELKIEPVIHFTSELPLARKFNEVSLLLDVYEKWGVKKIILGDRPNSRQAWPSAGWHYENLVDHFLDRFIPLANYAVSRGLTPIMPPLSPGGDYWDTAFAELTLTGLRQRRMDTILERLNLGCYGYTFNKALSWGSGGPQRWPLSKPYLTPDGQEDQLGFHNFEWIQAMGEQATGVKFPILILNAGLAGTVYSQPDPEKTLADIKNIHAACRSDQDDPKDTEQVGLDASITGMIFSLPALAELFPEPLTPEKLHQILKFNQETETTGEKEKQSNKFIAHYLLLPSHSSGVSDVVLSKVRPIIKKFHPAVGFSLEEASLARKVSVYPDPLLFGEEKLNALRAKGCHVEILPETGIDIATYLQGS